MVLQSTRVQLVFPQAAQIVDITTKPGLTCAQITDVLQTATRKNSYMKKTYYVVHTGVETKRHPLHSKVDIISTQKSPKKN